MRIDKALWFLRLASTRSAAQALVDAGHVFINGRRAERCSRMIAAGDRLVLPLPRGVLAIEIISLPHRRGPAPEAQSCYRVLDGAGNFSIAPTNRNTAAEGDLQP